MRATLSNLEKEEAAIVADYKAGSKYGHSMRQHLNNIRRHRLFEACEAENFEKYIKLERLPFDSSTAYRIGRQGEVEQHLEIGKACQFSGAALSKLATIRVINDDETVSHDIDIPKVKRAAKKALTYADNGKQVTPTMVTAAIEDINYVKPPKPFGEQLENRISSLGRLLSSYQELQELDKRVFMDAEKEYPGVVNRLAKAYSEIASYLRKVHR